MHQRYQCALGKVIDNVKEKSAHIELPVIKIPDFHGKSTEWQSFIELFNRIVHNNQSISESVKMQYLQTSLKGDAAKLVIHLAPNSNNYIVCYETLHKRYENKRELMNKIFDTFLNLAKHKTENSNDLRALYNASTEFLVTVKSMSVNTGGWNPFLNFIVFSKFHRDTITHYECQLENVKEIENIQEMLNYIENRSLAIQSAESKTVVNFGSNFKTKDKISSINEKMLSCIVCKESHSVSKCQKFLKLDTKNRSNIIMSNELCINCFGTHKY